MLSAFIVLRVLRGSEAYEQLFGPLLRWRVGVIWYVVALFGYPTIWLASIALSVRPEAHQQAIASGRALS